MSKQIRPSAPPSAEVLTADEVARWLRIPKTTLYKLCNEGQIPGTKIGRHWRFDRQTVEAWLRDRMTATRPRRRTKRP
jgi:excisionase family DNA binding protein